MTPDELAHLTSLLEQLVRIRGVRKDPAADSVIQRALEQQPDAGYLLVQRVLLLEQALDQAKARSPRSKLAPAMRHRRASLARSRAAWRWIRRAQGPGSEIPSDPAHCNRAQRLRTPRAGRGSATSRRRRQVSPPARFCFRASVACSATARHRSGRQSRARGIADQRSLRPRKRRACATRRRRQQLLRYRG